MGASSGATDRVWHSRRSRSVSVAVDTATHERFVSRQSTTSSNMGSASDLASQRINNKTRRSCLPDADLLFWKTKTKAEVSFKEQPKYKASRSACAGERPDRDSVVCSADGQLAPLDVSDAEGLQGLLPGWTVVSPPGVSRTSEAVVGEILNRWRVEGRGVRSVSRVDWTAFVGSVRERKRVRFQTKIRAKFPKWCDGNVVNTNEINPRDVRWATTNLEFVCAPNNSSCNDGVE